MKAMKIILIVMVLWLGAAALQAQDQPFVYDDQGKRDPFWRLVGPSGTIINYEKDLSVSDMALEGIMVGNSGNIAIINGMVVRKGDLIGGYTVQEVQPSFVVLEKGEEKFSLKLKKEE